MIKDIHSLNLKKYRDESGLFVAEGAKVVEDLLHLMRCKTLFATEEYSASLSYSIRSKVSDIEIVDAAQLKKLSNLSTPRDVVAVFEKKTVVTDVDELAGLPGKMLCLALDGVQDPGNLGTIIRLADWFGIEHILPRAIRLTCTPPRWYRLQWAPSRVWRFIMLTCLVCCRGLPNRVPRYMARFSMGRICMPNRWSITA